MSLGEYNKKRRFDRTPEPAGGHPSGQHLHFVVQQHHASHMHFDFRLEMRGVLKSWAVPKGPSIDPAVRRSAFMVEDHPYDYKDFEGIIPPGNYGAGSVIIWDQGYYQPIPKKSSRKEQEADLLRQLHAGKIEFSLHGSKLKGKFRLVHLPERGENNWLLIKIKDSYAGKKNILLQDKSVVSGFTVDEMADHPGARVWKSNRAAEKNQTDRKQTPAHALSKLLKKASKKKRPSKITPMSATLQQQVIEDPDWLYELKFDGYRIISYVNQQEVLLHSKGFLNFTRNFEPVTEALRALNINAVLDGEVIAVNEDGKPDFQALQKKKPELPLQYYVFDILWYDGYDLTALSLAERKQILQEVMVTDGVIRYSDTFDEGATLFEAAQQLGLEGVVGKNRNSSYVQRRSKEWIKVKAVAEADVVLAGWTESESGKQFRSLLFGYYDGNVLKYFGHVGHGFNKKNQAAINAELARLATRKKPFAEDVETTTKAHWLKPERVIRIRFDDITGSGKIRKPASFIAFRNDMDPKDVGNPVAELRTLEGTRQQPVISTSGAKKKTAKQNDDSNWPEVLQQKVSRTDVIEVEGHELTLINLEKEYWPNITKGDLLNYYIRIAPYILPHLQHRPLSLHLKLVRPNAPGLYIKDMEGREPSFAAIHTTPRLHPKKGKRNTIDYLVCNNLSTLIYAVNLGCIDLNPWTSVVQHEHEPSFVVIDLDPSDDDFKKAVTTAQAARQFFDEHRLKAFVKTSGKTGIHLFIPCSGFDFKQARVLAEHICSEVHALVPRITTTNVSVSSRGNKLYIDPNQNDYADTLAAAYSARPHGKPTVSAPLDWREVKDTLDMDAFTISNIEARLQKKGDLFSGVLDKKIAAANTKQLLRLL